MGDVALFNLLLEEETSATKVFEMNLQFEMADDTYKLTRLNFTLLIGKYNATGRSLIKIT